MDLSGLYSAAASATLNIQTVNATAPLPGSLFAGLAGLGSLVGFRRWAKT